MYLHRRGVVLFDFFGCGYRGFFTILRGGDMGGDSCDDGRRDDEDVGVVAVTVGQRVFASSALDVVVFVFAISEEGGNVGVWSVAGRLTSSALFFSCLTYSLYKKLVLRQLHELIQADFAKNHLKALKCFVEVDLLKCDRLLSQL
jgi:hypothetical protein